MYRVSTVMLALPLRRASCFFLPLGPQSHIFTRLFLDWRSGTRHLYASNIYIMDDDDDLDFPTDLEAQHLDISTSESKPSHFQLESTGNPNLLSRIRNFNFNNIARSSIGSLFSNTTTTSNSTGFSQHSDSAEDGDSLWNYSAEFDSNHAMAHSYISNTGTTELDSLEALTPRRMLTPTPLSQQHRFSDVKRAFNDNRTENIDYNPYIHSKPSSISRFAESPYATHQSGTTSNYMSISMSSRSEFSSSNSISTASENLDSTPPLTPDSFSGLALSSSSSFMSDEQDPSQHQYELQDLGYMRQNDLTPMQEINVDFGYTARHRSQEIKEGKKPERPIVCYLPFFSFVGIYTTDYHFPSAMTPL